MPLYIYIVAIFAASSIPGSSIPDVNVKSGDKIVHFVEYGILGFLLFRAFLSGGKKASLSAILAIICVAAVGALDESYQSTTGRNPSVYDWLADLLGATVSSCIMFLRTKRRKDQE